MDKFIGTEFRSRYVNPTWIEGMKKEGYAGAGAMREFVEYLWGWNATVPELVDDAMWKETFDVYVEDKHQLGMKEFFENKSPFAYQDMTARMVETVRKGYWKADAATEAKLLNEYVESVNKHGASGSEQTSGNARLSKYVMERGRAAGIPVPALEGFEKAMAQAMGAPVARAAKNAEAFAKNNDAREAADTAKANAQMKPGPAGPAAPQTAPSADAPVPAPAPPSTAAKLQGYLMEQEERAKAAIKQTASGVRDTQWDGLIVALPLLALLVVWRLRRRRSA